MSGFLQLWAFLIIRSLKSQVFYDSGVLCVLKHNSFKRTQLPTLASNNNTYITLKFKIKWKFGGHIFGHIFWIILLSKKYFTVNAIHEIPETNGYDSQHLDRALTSRFFFNINFWPIWTRPKKRDGFLRHLHDHGNALKPVTFFRPSSNWSKIYIFSKNDLWEHDQDVGYHTHLFQVSCGLHS